MTLMDTAQLLANLGDFVGAIVFVITLLYLAQQVRQNTKALHAQSRHAALAAGHAELLAVVEHPEIHLAQMRADTDTLTPEENVKVSYWLLVSMRSREFAWLQYRDGAIDDVQWNQESLVIQAILAPTVNRAWWTAIGRHVFAGEFVAFVDQVVAQPTPLRDLRDRFADWSSHRMGLRTAAER